MKKVVFILLVICLFGCSLGNTPTSQVEDLLTKYQTLDDSVNISYATLAGGDNLDAIISDRYKKVIETQYENMVYEVKDEKIDGDVATVTVEIEVLNYKDVINKYDADNYDSDDYHNNVLGDLENLKEKITYTIDFTLTKDNKGNWKVDDLTTEQVNKLLGIY